MGGRPGYRLRPGASPGSVRPAGILPGRGNKALRIRPAKARNPSVARRSFVTAHSLQHERNVPMERTPNTQYILSLSYGKDSLACLGAIEQ